MIPLISPVFSIQVAAQSNEPIPPLCDKAYTGAEAGILRCNEQTQEGYMLFADTASNKIYMIDERGEIRNSWVSDHDDGSGYGMDFGEDGSILRVVNDVPPSETPLLMDAGGGSTHIEILSWDGELVWEITQYEGFYRLHHDAVFLPNGNVLAIAWEYNSESTAIAMGRDEAKVTSEGLWTNLILEYAPNSQNVGEIVWEWHANEHLIQNTDPSLPNFGDPALYPHKIDINAIGPNNRDDDPDWMHCNSIDYDPIHDHIMLSCRNTEELYIIDHNLAWEETSTQYGDLLYRWGNPANYGAGSAQDHHTVVQHDAQFIPPGMPYAGSISYFSNEMTGSSYVGIVTLPRVGDAFALNNTSGMFDPSTPTVEFKLPFGWGPRFQSGATMLPNGQFMISHAMRGKIAQMGTDSIIDWEYNLPFNPGNEIADRTDRWMPPVFFKAVWIAKNDSRLDGLDINRMGVLETYTDNCPDDGDDILWDRNGDGCIEDDDNDGVTNDRDWCPNTPQGAEITSNGCEVVIPPSEGCKDPTALNFDPTAEVDDGSCMYPEPEVTGCMDTNATNYDENATISDETQCEYPPPIEQPGCMDEEAINFDESATVEDGTCEYPPDEPTNITGCMNSTSNTFDQNATIHDESLCEYSAENEGESTEIIGCTDSTALNFNPDATVSNNDCVYDEVDTTSKNNQSSTSKDENTDCATLGTCDTQTSIEDDVSSTDQTLRILLWSVGAMYVTILLGGVALFLKKRE